MEDNANDPNKMLNPIKKKVKDHIIITGNVGPGNIFDYLSIILEIGNCVN